MKPGTQSQITHVSIMKKMIVYQLEDSNALKKDLAIAVPKGVEDFVQLYGSNC